MGRQSHRFFRTGLLCWAVLVPLGFSGPHARKIDSPSTSRGWEAPCILQKPSDPFEAAARLTELPVEIFISNTSSRSLSPALVQGGVPFGRGRVADIKHIRLVDAGGNTLLLQKKPLAFWRDGSIKWAEFTFYLGSVPAGKRVRLGLVMSRGIRDSIAEDDAGSGDSTQSFARKAVFSLVDSMGATRFVAEDVRAVARGRVYEEYIWYGGFQGRKGRTEGTLSVSHFPRIKAVRYRPYIKQLVHGATWKSVTFTHAHPYARVHHGKEMGVQSGRNADGRPSVILIPQGDEPVDRGVGRRWEIWGIDEPDLCRSRPLPIQVKPEYLHATGVFGRFVIRPPASWESGFEASVARVFGDRDRNPRNFGWRHYGDFFTKDREKLAYYGYYDQEYDPAQSLYLAYARTGRVDYLEKAVDLACFYRDMCVSPDGGCYQHRATVHAAEYHIMTVLAGGDRRRAASFAPLFEKAQTLVKIKMGGMQGNSGGKIRRYCEALARQQSLRRIGYDDVDADFQPFFDRYGGSWDDFPAFHVDLHPDPKKLHTGGHSLVEMLVNGYFFTGDEGLREIALKVMRHHIATLAPEAIRSLQRQIDGPDELNARVAGWPLINLLTMAHLTPGFDDSLDKRAWTVMQQLAYQLCACSVERMKGSIHAGISLEALSRYHESTGDEKVARYIVALARYWAQTQWDQSRNGFNYERSKQGQGGPNYTGLVLYGLAYAQELAPYKPLYDRIMQAVAVLHAGTKTAYAKGLGMLYRSSPRGLDIVASWRGNAGRRGSGALAASITPPPFRLKKDAQRSDKPYQTVYVDVFRLLRLGQWEKAREACGRFSDKHPQLEFRKPMQTLIYLIGLVEDLPQYIEEAARRQIGGKTMTFEVVDGDPIRARIRDVSRGVLYLENRQFSAPVPIRQLKPDTLTALLEQSATADAQLCAGAYRMIWRKRSDALACLYRAQSLGAERAPDLIEVLKDVM